MKNIMKIDTLIELNKQIIEIAGLFGDANIQATMENMNLFFIRVKNKELSYEEGMKVSYCIMGDKEISYTMLYGDEVEMTVDEAIVARAIKLASDSFVFWAPHITALVTLVKGVMIAEKSYSRMYEGEFKYFAEMNNSKVEYHPQYAKVMGFSKK
jgi:hypothetical protein